MKRFFIFFALLAFVAPLAMAETSAVLTYESAREDCLRFTDSFGDSIAFALPSAQTAPAMRTGRSYRVTTENGVFLYAQEVQPKTAVGVFIDQAMHSVAFMGPRGELLSFYRQLSPGVLSFEGELTEGRPYRLTYLDNRLLCMEEAEVKTLRGVLTQVTADSLEIDVGGERFRFDAIWDAEPDSPLTPGRAVFVSYAEDRLLSVSDAEG